MTENACGPTAYRASNSMQLNRNPSRSLEEREIDVGTRARRVSVSTLFQVLPKFHECLYNAWQNVFAYGNMGQNFPTIRQTR